MRLFFLILCVVAAALYIWWTTTHPSGTWRYKLTVQIETPEGIKTGSSVREVYVNTGFQLTPESKPISRVKGEAVVIDLGSRGVVFALLRGFGLGQDHAKSLPFYAFPYKRGGLTPEGIKYYRSLKAGPFAVETELLPELVYFADLNKPLSVKDLIKLDRCPQTEPSERKYCISEDHFEEAFGKGVRLRSITIEMTDEPADKGKVSAYLKWLPGLKGRYLDGRRSDVGAGHIGLHGGNFQTRDK